jgi:hypothetical protein
MQSVDPSLGELKRETEQPTPVSLRPLNNFEPAFQKPPAIYASGSALLRSRSRSPTMFAPIDHLLVSDR